MSLPCFRARLSAWAALAAVLVVGAGTGCSSDPGSLSDATSVSPSGADRVPEGVWAGPHAVLTITAEGATAEFECATGVVTQPLSLDDRRRFDVPASHHPESGGPASTGGSRAPPIAARYRGRLIDAQHLTLTVVLLESGKTAGPFELTRGGQASLERCV